MSFLVKALKRTHPQGSTAQADAILACELMSSEKDHQENSLPGRFIKDIFHRMERIRWIVQQQRVMLLQIMTVINYSYDNYITYDTFFNGFNDAWWINNMLQMPVDF